MGSCKSQSSFYKHPNMLSFPPFITIKPSNGEIAVIIKQFHSFFVGFIYVKLVRSIVKL